jgi:hypothetical protein
MGRWMWSHPMLVGIFALVLVVATSNLSRLFGHYGSIDPNAPFFPPVSLYPAQAFDRGDHIKVYHELELQTSCTSALDLGHPWHHLRLESGQQLINPQIQWVDGTLTTDGWQIDTLYQQVESVEVSSVCRNYRDRVQFDNPTPMTQPDRRTVSRWNHVIVKFQVFPLLEYETVSFFNNNAICIQHYNDFLQRQWPCYWTEQFHDEL